jgi:neurofibromin 1
MDHASANSRQHSGKDSKTQGSVREVAIAGISNMLSANMDAGLKHCWAYGYHEDPRMRATFILIFTRVLRQGARFDGVEVMTTQPKHRRLCEMVKADMLLALAICETCPVSEMEVMMPVMINIFDTKGSLLALLKATIDKEVSRSGTFSIFELHTLLTFRHFFQRTQRNFSVPIQCARGCYQMSPRFRAITTSGSFSRHC